MVSNGFTHLIICDVMGRDRGGSTVHFRKTSHYSCYPNTMMIDEAPILPGILLSLGLSFVSRSHHLRANRSLACSRVFGNPSNKKP